MGFADPGGGPAGPRRGGRVRAAHAIAPSAGDRRGGLRSVRRIPPALPGNAHHPLRPAARSAHRLSRRCRFDRSWRSHVADHGRRAGWCQPRVRRARRRGVRQYAESYLRAALRDAHPAGAGCAANRRHAPAGVHRVEARAPLCGRRAGHAPPDSTRLRVARADAGLARRPRRGNVVRRRSAPHRPRIDRSRTHAHTPVSVAVQRRRLRRRRQTRRNGLAHHRRARVVSRARLGADARDGGHCGARWVGSTPTAEYRVGAATCDRRGHDDRWAPSWWRSAGQPRRKSRRPAADDDGGASRLLSRLRRRSGSGAGGRGPVREVDGQRTGVRVRRRRLRSSSSTCSRPTLSSSASTRDGTSPSTTRERRNRGAG